MRNARRENGHRPRRNHHREYWCGGDGRTKNGKGPGLNAGINSSKHRETATRLGTTAVPSYCEPRNRRMSGEKGNVLFCFPPSACRKEDCRGRKINKQECMRGSLGTASAFAESVRAGGNYRPRKQQQKGVANFNIGWRTEQGAFISIPSQQEESSLAAPHLPIGRQSAARTPKTTTGGDRQQKCWHLASKGCDTPTDRIDN